jgi:hypothetical protein
MKFNKRVMKGVYDRTSYNTSATPYSRTAPEPIQSQDFSTNVDEAKQPKQPNIIKAITDKEGLDKAYAADEKLYVNGKTMYVAGTSNMQDVWDDLKIPFGKTAKAQRYKDADTLLAANPQVENLVGHSLGGASVLELQKTTVKQTSKQTSTAHRPYHIQARIKQQITDTETMETPSLSLTAVLKGPPRNRHPWVLSPAV